MVKLGKAIEKEYKLRIEAVVDFILKNTSHDVSLRELASIANYSPYHFQKIFKLVIGETPKQFVIKLRLGTALHLIVIHPHKSILEVAMDCGFSSPSIFSRAVKSYFGISPDKIRSLTNGKRVSLLKKVNPKLASFHGRSTNISKNKITVRVTKLSAITGFYVTAPFNDTAKIRNSFKHALKLANVYDVFTPESKCYGILNPNQCNIYKAFVSSKIEQSISNKLNRAEIKAGKYASFQICGGEQETIHAAHIFYHEWLPGSGYKIAGDFGFETFGDNPSALPYSKLRREVYMPIEPA